MYFIEAEIEDIPDRWPHLPSDYSKGTKVILMDDDVEKAYAHIIKDRGCLSLLVTHPEYQGKGYGDALLKYVLQHYSISYLTSKSFGQSSKNDQDLLDWYTSYGFEFAGYLMKKNGN